MGISLRISPYSGIDAANSGVRKRSSCVIPFQRPFARHALRAEIALSQSASSCSNRTPCPRASAAVNWSFRSANHSAFAKHFKRVHQHSAKADHTESSVTARFPTRFHSLNYGSGFRGVLMYRLKCLARRCGLLAGKTSEQAAESARARVRFDKKTRIG